MQHLWHEAVQVHPKVLKLAIAPVLRCRPSSLSQGCTVLIEQNNYCVIAQAGELENFAVQIAVERLDVQNDTNRRLAGRSYRKIVNL